jgi:MFS family permease
MSAVRWRRAPERASKPEPERSLIVLIRVLVMFESALYSAVTPVLPHYAHTLHASKPAVGLLAAAYSAGLIPGSLLGGWIAARAGVRRTTLAGLLAFSVAVAGFGFGTDIIALDALRIVQGVACGFLWGGALTWVIAAAPRERRGAVLGSVIGAAIFGTLLGPLLGTLAVTAGTKLVFSMVGAIALGLAVWVREHPEPPRPVPGPRTPLKTLWRASGLGLGTWLITLEAIAFGATSVLIPLRLAKFGASGVAIGATFLLASALSAGLAGWVGRITDRRGARLPIAIGLVTSAALLALLALPHSAWLLAALSVIALGGPMTAYMIPAVAMMTESAERAGIALVLTTTLVNLAYALGETIGAPIAAGLSQATSDAAPILLISVLMLATLRPVIAVRLGQTGSSSAAPRPVALEPR